MLQALRRRQVLAVTAILLFAAGLGILTVRYLATRPRPEATSGSAAPGEVPADLEKLLPVWEEGVAAMQRDDGPEAARLLSSFDFGSRPVDEYRLYYLAQAHQLAGNAGAARATLARLWRRKPALIYSDDVAFNLANLYENGGDWPHAAEVFSALARSADVPAVAAAARWEAARSRLQAGDVSGAFFSARNLLIRNPASPEAKHAAAFVRAVSGLPGDAAIPLTPTERLERATALVAAGSGTRALEELSALDPQAPHLRAAIRLQSGIALHQLRRHEEAAKTLDTLAGGPYTSSIPALRYAARSYIAIAAAIDPNIVKTVKERKRVGTTKVRVGKGKKRRTVLQPKYQTVFRKVTLVDLPKKQKKEETDRLAGERLKDLLSLPLNEELSIETLGTLIARAQARNQDPYLRELVTKYVALEPDADPALQYFWDKGWAAWIRGDPGTARPLFRFIADTYTHPNVRRQAEYWYARAAARQGDREEASAIYRKLAAAPYADLYAMHSVTQGARREDPRGNPLKKGGPDWREIAEKQMPADLRIAYELTALSSMREAYLEIRRNMSRKNVRFAEALMAEVHHSAGNDVLLYRSLRRAWPQLATVEQDTVPPHFLKMYYPMQFTEEIEEYSSENGLDANLVRALILQESYYNTDAKSPVGATGLMQLMPPTAQDHARKLRIAFVVSRLEDPRINIQLGTFHLRMLLRLFNGNTHLAVASYNAGQGNVAKWRRANPKRPMDEFIEAIPFQETRNYVKRVTMLRSSYRRLST